MDGTNPGRVSVLIPWYKRENPGQDYDQRWETLTHIHQWWGSHHPTWEIVVGEQSDAEGPWRKGLAVHRALLKSTGDICVVADADVLCEGVAAAVDEIASLRHPWAVPHLWVFRLTQQSTRLVVEHGRYPPVPWRPGVSSPDFTETYRGVPGGGIVVLPRQLLAEIPMDPRFEGWGQEDYAWARALTALSGHPWRGRSPLLHLWHEPQDRISRGVGSPEGYGLWQEYQRAAHRLAMLELIDGARSALDDHVSVVRS